jgi:uncharacterized protein (TIGR00375 family)
MKFVADFHIHSHYSVATSRDLKPESLDLWGRIKGIRVIGAGDFTHPEWVKELKNKLEEAEPGLFRLKDKFRRETQSHPSPEREVRFLLTAEISTIYKKSARVRKTHNIIFAPDFKTCEKIQKKITKIGGNITSDGRPILGMDSRNLLELCLEASKDIFFVPAHIWTPWFSILGDKSGFDSPTECFEDLTQYIHAVETGLSSDPPMNWLCSFLDRFTLLSNSDAHSPEKLGRNANIFNTELSYEAIVNAIKTGDPEQCLGTIDLFPQEGKYHFDGHRKCNIVWSPIETFHNKGICPKCGKTVTIGVMNRVAQVSDRDDPLERENRLPFYSLIPLKEILSEITGSGEKSKKVEQLYHKILGVEVSELELLLDTPIQEIERRGGSILVEAIRRMRNRQVHISEGFDGEFGKVLLFEEGEMELFRPEPSLFDIPISLKTQNPRPLINFDLKKYRKLCLPDRFIVMVQEEPEVYPTLLKLMKELNAEQQKAATHFTGPALIIAGPGSGKTHTLACRMAHLIEEKEIAPESILGVTFTNKAAGEMKKRITRILKNPELDARLRIFTFHGLGYFILKEQLKKTGRTDPFFILEEEDKNKILKSLVKGNARRIKKISGEITEIKQKAMPPDNIKDKELFEIYSNYEKTLEENSAFDLDDLIHLPLKIFREDPEVLSHYQKQYPWVMVDEYQDINRAQYETIRMLMPGSDANLCVIGDPNQSIYGFRGADVRFIREFKIDYPGAAVYRLKKSYRCSRYILQASENIILDGEDKKGILEGLDDGVKIRIAENPTDKSEGEFVARSIERMIGGTRFFSMDSDVAQGSGEKDIHSLSDFAVLCRTGSLMPALVKAFDDHHIPCQVVDTAPFFRKEPVRSVIAMLGLVYNPKNPFLKKKIAEKKIPLDSDIFREKAPESEKELTDLIWKIINQHFADKYSKDREDFDRLADLAQEFKDDPGEFLRILSLGTGLDVYQTGLESVNLMTIHAAKGLEFPCVFIVGCEDGILPYSLFERKKGDEDEERRLLYVGMTRARKYLFLTHAKRRTVRGKEFRLPRSPFLDRLEQDILEYEQKRSPTKSFRDDPQLTLF